MEAEEFALTNLLLVALLAFAVPFVPAFFPRVRVASPVLELVAGIMFGPAAGLDRHRRSRGDHVARVRRLSPSGR